MRQPHVKNPALKPLLEEFRQDSLRAQVQEAKDETARLQGMIDTFCRETLSAMQARDLAQSLAAASFKVRDEVQRELAAIKTEWDGSVHEKEEILRKLDELGRQLESARKSQAEKEEQLEQDRRARVDAETRLETVVHEKEALLRERDELDLQLEDARKSRAEAEAQREQDRRALAEADARHEYSLSQERAASLDEKEKLQSERAELSRRLEEASQSQALSRRHREEDLRLFAAMEAQGELDRRAHADNESRLESWMSWAMTTIKTQREASALEKERLVRERDELGLQLERARISQEERPSAPRREAAEALEPAAEASTGPSLSGLFDPPWTKVLPNLRQSVATAFARLKQLPLGAIPEGPRAMIRLAAVSLSQTSDMLKVLEEFFDEGGPAAEEGRVETTVEAALTAWESALRQKKIAVSRQIDPGLPKVLVVGAALRVAVFQIVRNAHAAMPAGGTLTVKAARDEASGGIILRFSDTGRGFSPEALTSLFAAFTRARPGHLGLGLSLARRNLRRMGGDVEARNGPSGGAVVEFRLVPASGTPALP